MKASLHLIVDGRTSLSSVRAALASGVDVVQLRDRSAAAKDLWQLAQDLLPALRVAQAGLIINDRLDVAQVVAASGVHLAGRSLAPQLARPLAAGLVLGASVHSVKEAEAIAPWVDYLTFGSIYPTQSHPKQPEAGLQALADVAKAVPCPVLAIGGIGPKNAEDVIRAGASGVVVISSLLGAQDVGEAARQLRRALDAAPDPRHPDPVLVKGGVL